MSRAWRDDDWQALADAGVDLTGARLGGDGFVRIDLGAFGWVALGDPAAVQLPEQVDVLDLEVLGWSPQAVRLWADPPRTMVEVLADALADSVLEDPWVAVRRDEDVWGEPEYSAALGRRSKVFDYVADCVRASQDA